MCVWCVWCVCACACACVCAGAGAGAGACVCARARAKGIVLNLFQDLVASLIGHMSIRRNGYILQVKIIVNTA